MRLNVCVYNVGALYFKSVLSSYFQYWILESNTLTIFEMLWIDKLISPLAYILKIIFVELYSHIIYVQSTFGLCCIILVLLYYVCVSLCDYWNNAKTNKFVVIVPRIAAQRRCAIVRTGSQLSVGCRKRFDWREKAFETKRRLVLIGKLRICCKAWKRIVDSTVAYNALRLAAHEYSMGPHGIPELCLPREHNLVKLFKMNFMLFSQRWHVTFLISKRILRSDLGDLSLRSLAKLRNELELN